MGVPTSDTSSATSTAAATAARLKREDFRRTKHDSAFSQWKILIGAFDWEDHSKGKEGAEKYRTQNLPNWTSCPGVYELGIATSRPQSKKETRKFDSSSIVPVYLGQADNLRTRLQQYGRDGAHLENGCSNNKISGGQSFSSHKEPGLFMEIFSRGLPIVYRCAPMQSKKDAEITEKQLLDKFDYAWNKGSNGARRQGDICKILNRLDKASQFSLLAKKFLFSNQRKVGIKIRTASASGDMDNNTIFASGDMDNSTIFSRILGVRRLQARQVQYGSGDYCNDICGVATGHGSICTIPPVAGRKRCAIHKGLRVNGYISKLNTEGKFPPNAASMEYDIVPDRHCSGDYCNNICGVAISHGSICTNSPVAGRKRCAMHKGLRVNAYISKLSAEKVPPIAASIASSMIPDRHCPDFQDQEWSHSRETHHPCEHATAEKFTPICGFILDDGSPCKMKPVQGNKRCLEHKGRRICRSNLTLHGKK